MKYDAYHIISTILEKLSLAKTIKHTVKGVGRNLKKDPVSLGLIVVPIPGTSVAGTALHLAKIPGSRKRLMVTGRKLIRPTEW